MNDNRLGPEYSIFSHSSGEPLHTVEMHVLARAYRAVWRSLYASDPLGPHVIAPLDVLLVFSADDVEAVTWPHVSVLNQPDWRVL